jgi:hypothetical protein
MVGVFFFFGLILGAYSYLFDANQCGAATRLNLYSCVLHHAYGYVSRLCSYFSGIACLVVCVLVFILVLQSEPIYSFYILVREIFYGGSVGRGTVGGIRYFATSAASCKWFLS